VNELAAKVMNWSFTFRVAQINYSQIKGYLGYNKTYSQPFHSLLNNTTLSPGFLGQWFNNLQRAALLMASVKCDKFFCKFGQQCCYGRLHCMSCDFNQSQTVKYFE